MRECKSASRRADLARCLAGHALRSRREGTSTREGTATPTDAHAAADPNKCPEPAESPEGVRRGERADEQAARSSEELQEGYKKDRRHSRKVGRCQWEQREQRPRRKSEGDGEAETGRFVWDSVSCLSLDLVAGNFAMLRCRHHEKS